MNEEKGTKTQKCPNCGSTDLIYPPAGFAIGGITKGWLCRNCRLLFGYGEEKEK